jgi:hypothetical protein
MPRPQKEGLDYFPLDVDIADDDKMELIEAKHGLIGFAVVIRLLMRIYKSGYYYKWTEKEQLLFSKRIDVDINTVNEVINDAIKWELFDKKMLDKYEILTSKGIQKRYLEAVKRRQKVEMMSIYLLLKGNCLNEYTNIEIVNINLIDDDINPQSKVKESKVNKSIGAGRFAPPTVTEITAYCKERNNDVDAERFHDFYQAKGWMVGKNKMSDWKAAVRTWEKKDRAEPDKPSIYDRRL